MQITKSTTFTSSKIASKPISGSIKVPSQATTGTDFNMQNSFSVPTVHSIPMRNTAGTVTKVIDNYSDIPDDKMQIVTDIKPIANIGTGIRKYYVEDIKDVTDIGNGSKKGRLEEDMIQDFTDITYYHLEPNTQEFAESISASDTKNDKRSKM